MTGRGKIGGLQLVGKTLERTMSDTKITKDQLPLAKGAKLTHLKREEPPVRWPSAATGSGAAYGVTLTPVPEEVSVPDGCNEN